MSGHPSSWTPSVPAFLIRRSYHGLWSLQKRANEAVSPVSCTSQSACHEDSLRWINIKFPSNARLNCSNQAQRRASLVERRRFYRGEHDVTENWATPISLERSRQSRKSNARSVSGSSPGARHHLWEPIFSSNYEGGKRSNPTCFRVVIDSPS